MCLPLCSSVIRLLQVQNQRRRRPTPSEDPINCALESVLIFALGHWSASAHALASMAAPSPLPPCAAQSVSTSRHWWLGARSQ